MNTQVDYSRGVGHVLSPGHDVKNCTACAYRQGRADERQELADHLETVHELRVLLRRHTKMNEWLIDVWEALARGQEYEVFALLDEHLLDTLRVLFPADFETGE